MVFPGLPGRGCRPEFVPAAVMSFSGFPGAVQGNPAGISLRSIRYFREQKPVSEGFFTDPAPVLNMRLTQTQPSYLHGPLVTGTTRKLPSARREQRSETVA